MVSCDFGYSTVISCSTEGSKLFYFYRLGEVVPREAYIRALRAVELLDGDVIFGGFGLYLLGFREIGVHDIDIATDSPRCIGRCLEEGDGVAVSEVDKIAVKMYRWDKTLVRPEEHVVVDTPAGKVKVAELESAIAWWIQRVLNFLNSPHKGEELRAYKAAAELAYLWLTGQKDVGKVAGYIQRYKDRVEGYSAFPAMVREVEDGACFLFYDHFGASVKVCKDALAEIASLF
ncbi:MAG: hypothetical protein ACP5I3_10720 [Thermoproteus sp.]